MVKNNLKIVVAMTCESGGHRLAGIFNSLHIRAGCNEVFTSKGVASRPEIECDISWSCIPYLDLIQQAGIMIAHQVRHPLWVVNDLLERSFYRHSDIDTVSEYVYLSGNDEALDILRYWIAWNKIIEATGAMRWRFENIRFDLIRGVVAAAGYRVTNYECSRVLNKHKPKRNDACSITWGDIPDSREKIVAMTLAKRYGYIY